MWAFVKKSILFISTWLLLTLGLVGVMFYYIKQTSFRIDPEKNILFLGDSHTECAINDSIYKKAFNISQSGQPYLLSSMLLKQVLKANPQIDTVALSFNYGSLTKYADREWHTQERLEVTLPYLLPFLSAEDLYTLKCNSGLYSSIFQSQFNFVKYFNNISKLKTLNVYELGVGEYFRIDRSKLEESIEKSPERPDNYMYVDTATIQFRYLKKIQQICHEKGVTLILFDTPLYLKHAPSLKANFDSQRKKYINIPYIDYSDFPLTDNCYGDADHLNYIGAEIFSKYLNSHGISAISNE